MMQSTARVAMAVVVVGWVLVGSAEARSLKAALVPQATDDATKEIIAGSIAPLAQSIGSQVANQIPTLSTSAGYTYQWNPELEVLERSAKTFGPLFSERAVTVGRGKFNINASYTYIKFDEFNGRNIDRLTNRIEKAFVPENGDTEYFGLFRSFNNGTQFAGDQVRVGLDIEAQLFDFSFTYGLLDNLDVNFDLPVLRTYAKSTFQETLPDPRCLGNDVSNSEDCQAALQLGGDDNGFFHFGPLVSRGTKLGIGDMHFRTKWAPISEPVRLAGLLDLAVPTGDLNDFQGTGDTRIGTTLIASRDIFSMFELHSQGGIEFNCDDVDRSQARYAAGVTAQLATFMAVTVDFLGRSEFGAQGRIPNLGRLPAVRNIDGVPTLTQPLNELQDPNAFKGRPLFVDIKRNDILDLAIGGRFAIGDRAMILANFLVPLNEDGLRANFIPTLAVETNF